MAVWKADILICPQNLNNVFPFLHAVSFMGLFSSPPLRKSSYSTTTFCFMLFQIYTLPYRRPNFPYKFNTNSFSNPEIFFSLGFTKSNSETYPKLEWRTLSISGHVPSLFHHLSNSAVCITSTLDLCTTPAACFHSSSRVIDGTTLSSADWTVPEIPVDHSRWDLKPSLCMFQI